MTDFEHTTWDPAKVVSGARLWITAGTYQITSDANQWSNLVDVEIYCEPGVFFVDQGQTALAERMNVADEPTPGTAAGTVAVPSTTTVRSPRGIRFSQCQDVRWTGYAEFQTTGSGLTGGSGYTWGVSNYTVRRPAFFFEECTGCSWEGYLNLNPGRGVSSDAYTGDPAKNNRNLIAQQRFGATPTAQQYQTTTMRGYAFHAYKCVNLKINLRGFGNVATREQIGLADCINSYVTGGNTRPAGAFNGSYFKLLSNKGLLVENVNASAFGDASLMDVSGENIEVRSISGSFSPGAKAVDYTQEWDSGANVDNASTILSGVHMPDGCYIAIAATKEPVAINKDLTIRDARGRLNLPSVLRVKVYNSEIRNSTNAHAAPADEQIWDWFDCAFVWNASFAGSVNLFRLGRRMRFKNCSFMVEPSAVSAGMTQLVFRPQTQDGNEAGKDRWVEFYGCTFSLASGCIVQLATNTRLFNTSLPTGWTKGTPSFNGTNLVQRNPDLTNVTP